jgi:hypothetical protein
LAEELLALNIQTTSPPAQKGNVWRLTFHWESLQSQAAVADILARYNNKLPPLDYNGAMLRFKEDGTCTTP